RGGSPDLERQSECDRENRDDGCGWCRPKLHGTRPDSRHAESAEARGPIDQGHWPDRAERGVRGAGDCLHPCAEAGPREGEHLRRWHLVGSPVGLHRCEDPHHAGPRLIAPEYAVRSRHHVHRRWARDCDDRRARLMAAYDRILVEISDHIGTVTLNRPEKANAFDPDMCDDLLEALRMVSSADQVRVIVITGAGKTFCAGA